jgi:HPt (histidine-containing phosphotransfer) domain-containing protein
MNYSAGIAEHLFGTDQADAFTPASAPPLAPADQLIDLDHLARMTLGDPGLEREVLRLFDQQAGMLLERMTKEAPRIVAALAHTMIGSARGVGAWKVAVAAEAVQRLAGKPGPATLTAAMNRLSTAVAETQSAIAERLREHTSERL